MSEAMIGKILTHATLALAISAASTGRSEPEITSLGRFGSCGRLSDEIIKHGLTLDMSANPYVVFDRHMALMAIENFAETNAPVRELLEIFVRYDRGEPHALGASSLRAELEDWRTRHRIAMRFLYSDEIAGTLSRLQDEGALPRESEHIQGINGLMSYLAWNTLVAGGVLPLVDPHDSLTHVPSLVLPGLIEALVGKARFTAGTVALVGEPYPSVLQSEPSSLPRPLHEAAIAALSWSNNVIRANTYEGLAFLSSGQGGPKLVVQGNMASRVAAALNGKEKFVGTIESVLVPEPLHELSRLPRIREFMLEEPELARRIAELMAILGVTESRREELRAKIARITTPLMAKPANQESAFERTARVLDGLARAAADDAELTAFFNYENRLEFLQKGVVYMEKYLAWFRTH